MPKKFIFKSEDGDVNFSDYLSSFQCIDINKNGHRCTKHSLIGIPYCWIHLQYNHYLKIKKSTIPNGGLGLFAFNKKAGDNPIFKKGEKIIQYVGENIDLEELNERYNKYTGPYAIQVNKNLYIDAALERGVGSLINHKNKSNTNCEFMNSNKKKEIWIRATKNIYHDQELFLNYGRDYKFHEPTEHKTINARN